MNRDEARALGVKTYTADKPCKRGHEPIRYVSTKSCRQCLRDHEVRYSIERPEVRRDARRKLATVDREAKNAARRERRRARPDKPLTREQKARKAEWMRQWQRDNPDKVRAASRRSQADPKWRAKQKEWSESEAGKASILATAARRRARKLNAMPADFDPVAVKACYAVSKTLQRHTGEPYEVDHIAPLAGGGLHHHSNLVVLRRDLNRIKGNNEWPWLRWFNEPLT